MINMKEKYVPKKPDIMEAIFDTCYLLFDLVDLLYRFGLQPRQVYE